MTHHHPALRYRISANFHSALSVFSETSLHTLAFTFCPASIQVFFLSRFSFLTHACKVKPLTDPCPAGQNVERFACVLFFVVSRGGWKNRLERFRIHEASARRSARRGRRRRNPGRCIARERRQNSCARKQSHHSRLRSHG